MSAILTSMENAHTKRQSLLLRCNSAIYVKRVGIVHRTRPAGCCDMQPSRIITDYFGLGLTEIDPLLHRYARKTIFTFWFPEILTFDL